MRLGLPNILTIIFVIARILGYIEWSWWFVFLPSIIWAVLVAALFVIVFVLEFINENKIKRN